MSKQRRRSKKKSTRQNWQLAKWPWRRIAIGFGLAFSLLCLLALLAPQASGPSRSVATFLLRLFGWAAYLFPVALAAAIYWFAIRRSSLDPLRTFGALLILYSVLVATHLAAHLPNPFVLSVGGYGGGFLAWLLVALFLGSVGRLGAYLFTIVLSLIGIMFTFRASLLRLLQYLIQKAQKAHSKPQPQIKKPSVKKRTASLPPVVKQEAPVAPPWVEEEPAATPESKPAIIQAIEPVQRYSATPSKQVVQPEPPVTVPKPVMPEQNANGSDWQLPDITAILHPDETQEDDDDLIDERWGLINDTLRSLGVPAEVVDVQKGPTITQFAVKPGAFTKRNADGSVKSQRVRVSTIASLADDLALALSAESVRIEAPIPGRSVIGVEVPNPKIQRVGLLGVLASLEYQRLNSLLALALGRDISGKPLVSDLAKMPHLLIAGATNSGKSVCLNTIIACLLSRNTPDTLLLVLVDPKRVELTNYSGLPHVIGNVVSDPEEAIGILKWATKEMDRRYATFSDVGVRDIKGYNARVVKDGGKILPRIVVVIDELSDLMMNAAYEVERTLCRLAQMARATGIHLVIATQRPSVDVLTGLIKANFPARIAFHVPSNADSRVVLGTFGAEKLLGQGDMLYMGPGSSRLIRAQGCWVSDNEIAAIIRHWKGAALNAPAAAYVQATIWPQDKPGKEKAEDTRLDEAIAIVKQQGRASVTMLQRHLSIGYNRAASMLDTLVEKKIVSPNVDGPFASHSLLADETEEATGEEEMSE